MVDAIAKRFIARPDVVAVHHASGAYTPREMMFSRKAILDHVNGVRSYGHYLLDTESNCKLFAYDLDLRKKGTACEVNVLPTGPQVLWNTKQECNPREEWANPESPLRMHLAMQLRGLAEGIAWRARRAYGFDTIISYSGGKGMHVYVLCGKRPAADARGMSIALLETWRYGDTAEPMFRRLRGDVFWEHVKPDYNCVDVEMFPKQDSVAPGEYGNLMRLPLGVHAASKRRAFFVDMSAPLTRSEFFRPDNVLLTLKEGSIRV